jgi:protein-disulfide isomerase
MTKPGRLSEAVIGISLTGAVACAAATVLSALSRVGLTPPVLYGKTKTIATMLRWEGVPVEYIGLIWFATVATLVLLSRNHLEYRPHVNTLVSWSSIPMTGLGGWLIWREQVLPWATGMGVACALALMIITISNEQAAVRTFRLIDLAGRRKVRAVALATLALALVGAQAIRFVASRQTPIEAAQASFDRWYRAQTPLSDPGLMSPAPITVVVFTDYQCPTCRANVPSNYGLVEDLAKANNIVIDLITRDFPLEPECNRSVGREVHALACEAAVAVRLTRSHLGDERARDLGLELYARGRSLTREHISQQLVSLGLESVFSSQYAAMVRDLSDESVAAAVIGVTGTPTYFVNGVRLPTYELVERAVRYQIARLAPRIAASSR